MYLAPMFLAAWLAAAAGGTESAKPSDRPKPNVDPVQAELDRVANLEFAEQQAWLRQLERRRRGGAGDACAASGRRGAGADLPALAPEKGHLRRSATTAGRDAAANGRPARSKRQILQSPQPRPSPEAQSVPPRPQPKAQSVPPRPLPRPSPEAQSVPPLLPLPRRSDRGSAAPPRRRSRWK